MVESSAMSLLAGWDQNVVTDPKDSHFYQMLSYPTHGKDSCKTVTLRPGQCQ
jgi:hypothetical protein